MSGLVFWLHKWFQGEIISIPGRLIGTGFFLFLLILPLFTKNLYFLETIVIAAILSIYAASWDVLAGFTGQINLGHALFFGVGAYTTAFLNLKFALPPYVCIPVGAISALLAGVIVGLPALRLRGIYLSLVSLGFPIILSGVILIFPEFTGGELGLSGISHLSDSTLFNYYIVNLTTFISLFLMYKFTDAESKTIRVGVILHAIREDEITARTSGINTTRYKLLAFATSGFFAGIAGSLYAHIIRIAGPSTLELLFSFQAILWTIFGGITTIYGPVTGVFVLYPFTEFLCISQFGEYVRFIVLALMMIFVLLFMPEGLAIWVRDKIEIKCPRCKLTNVVLRQYCRACGAPLHLKENQIKEKGGGE